MAKCCSDDPAELQLEVIEETVRYIEELQNRLIDTIGEEEAQHKMAQTASLSLNNNPGEEDDGKLGRPAAHLVVVQGDGSRIVELEMEEGGQDENTGPDGDVLKVDFATANCMQIQQQVSQAVKVFGFRFSSLFIRFINT